MGVSDFLPKILASAGRPIDLRDYKDRIVDDINIRDDDKTRTRRDYGKVSSNDKDNKCRRRPLRIGIDVHSWIYTAGYAFSDRLGDGRHLTNYGRANLMQEQMDQRLEQNRPSDETIQEYVTACTNYVLKRLQTVQEATNAQILVVLDGRSPPVKAKEVMRRRQLAEEQNRVRHDPNVMVGASPGTLKAANDRRTKAFKRAGPGPHVNKILVSLVQALKATSNDSSTPISFMVAPYEADAQLAYLARQHYIDLVITEDSDLMAHGAPAILYKSGSHISDGIPSGLLVQYQDIGAITLETPGSSSSININLMDFTPVMMAVLFRLLGCDYNSVESKSLKGIGLVTAHKIVRKAFLDEGSVPQHISNNNQSIRPSVLSSVWKDAYMYSYNTKESLTPEFKLEYENAFMAALLMYRHPIVFDPHLQKCIHVDCQHSQRLSQEGNGMNALRVSNIWGDSELLEYEPYAQLCGDQVQIATIVGELPPKEDAVGIVEGRISWRNKKPTPLTSLAAAIEVNQHLESIQSRNKKMLNEPSRQLEGVTIRSPQQIISLHGRPRHRNRFVATDHKQAEAEEHGFQQSTSAGEETAEHPGSHFTAKNSVDNSKKPRFAIRDHCRNQFPTDKSLSEITGGDNVWTMKINKCAFGLPAHDPGENITRKRGRAVEFSGRSEKRIMVSGRSVRQNMEVEDSSLFALNEEEREFMGITDETKFENDSDSDQDDGPETQIDENIQDTDLAREGLEIGNHQGKETSPAPNLINKFVYDGSSLDDAMVEKTSQSELHIDQGANRNKNETRWKSNSPLKSHINEAEEPQTTSSKKKRRGKRDRDYGDFTIIGETVTKNGIDAIASSNEDAIEAFEEESDENESHDSDATVPISENQYEAISENLLASTTPEKSLSSSYPAQPSHSSRTLHSKFSSQMSSQPQHSPNLLASTTSEKSQSSSQPSQSSRFSQE